MATPTGSYAYCLNMALPASTVVVTVNSKRVMCDFRLTAVNGAYLSADGGGWVCILGTEHENWFGGYVRAETIFGNGALPHLLPVGANRVVNKGDYIVVRAINLSGNSTVRVALAFQGVHI